MSGSANLVTAKAGSAIVEGEFLLTMEDFRSIAAMLRADAGIALSEGKATLLYSRLAKRLRALGLTSFSAYCRVLAAPGSADERRRMLTSLTTNVTRFFREPHHFEHLRLNVLPPLLDAAAKGGRVRLWSAACSTGQEPYSIALTILSLLPNAASLDVRVLATDIDPVVLEEARAGCYSDESLSPVPAALRQRWLRPLRDGASVQGAPAMWQVGDEVAGLVSFRELNLVGGAWPMRNQFDVIMCRNVLIYFAEDTQAEVFQRFAPLVAPGGRLYIGHSERLSGPAATSFQSEGITTYRRLPIAGGRAA